MQNLKKNNSKGQQHGIFPILIPAAKNIVRCSDRNTCHFPNTVHLVRFTKAHVIQHLHKCNT